MKSIVTKYHGPGNVRGSRISATDSDKNRVSIPIDPIWSTDTMHTQAAVALCRKMNWHGTLMAGYLKSGSQVFVWINKDQFTV